MIRRLDWVIVTTASLLVFFGLASTSFGLRQIAFFIIGLAMMVIASLFDWRSLKENSYLILALYLVGILLLVGLFFFAPLIKGVRRWYSFGPIFFDPVEYVKLILIIFLAKYFSQRHVEMYRFSHLVFSGLYVALPSAITLLQPDLGSALVLVLLWLGVLLLSGIKTNHLIILILIGAILFSLGWLFFLKDYQKVRLTAFLKPKLDPQGINWNPEQAKIAIGSGGVLGFGFGNGPQTRYGFLPEPETDFIFSAIAEESGFLGISILITLFTILIWKVVSTVLIAPDNFSRLYCSGVAITLMIQLFVNIGMNLGLLPIVGIPLPLVSHGGSNLLFSLISLGIVQSIRADA